MVRRTYLARLTSKSAIYTCPFGRVRSFQWPITRVFLGITGFATSHCSQSVWLYRGLHRFSWREPSPTVRAEFRNLFAYAPKEVCVAAIAQTAQQPPSMPLLITVGGGRTTPVTVVVAPGTRLHFENRDPFPHRLYGVNQTTFPAGEMGQGAARDWTAPGPGKYEVRDELAPSIRTWVIVEPNVAAIAYPSVQGAFSIPQLAPGEYTMKAFFAGNPVGTPKSVAVAVAPIEVVMPVAAGVDAGERD
jgi:hypothetical protein